MPYQNIVEAIGSDLQSSTQFSQGEVISKWAQEMDRGQCSGHAIDWLIARYDGNDYLAAYGPKLESTSLLAEKKSSNSATTIQKMIRGNWRQVAALKLSEKKMVHKPGESSSNSVVNIDVGRDAIANLVLDGTCRYFILYINGTRAAHLIGIHRPWKLIGKSSSSFVFDPNYGQFECKNKMGLKRAMRGIRREYGDRVASTYSLLAFLGKGW